MLNLLYVWLLSYQNGLFGTKNEEIRPFGLKNCLFLVSKSGYHVFT